MNEIETNAVMALWVGAESDALQAMADAFEEAQRTVIPLEDEEDDDPPPTAPSALAPWEEAA